MGIKDVAVKVAGKAGDAVAKVSSLSPDQLEKVQAKRDEFLSQMPDPNDPAAVELTERLIAACGVEIYSAYLPQIDKLYAPIDPAIEYGERFDAEHNIRVLNITKWVIDPDENSLEKLVNVYDVLSNDQCNIALVFNRTKATTNIYLAVVDAKNSDSNDNAENFKRRISDALKGNFPGSEIKSTGFSSIPSLEESDSFSVATVSSIPAEKSEEFVSQTIEKVLDGVVPSKHSEEYTIVLLATPVRDVEQRKLRLAELYTALAPYASWQTNFTFTESDATMSMATVGVNAGVSAGVQNGTNSSLASNASQTGTEASGVTDSTGTTETDTTGATTTDTTGESKSITGSVSVSEQAAPGGVGVSATESISTTGETSSSHSVAETASKAVGKTASKAISKTLSQAATRGLTKTAGVFESANLGGNFGASFARASSVTATIGKNEGIAQSFTNYAIKHALEMLEEQMERLDLASALGMWDFAAYVVSEDLNVASNVAHSYLALAQGKESYLSQAAVNIWRGDMGEASGGRGPSAAISRTCDIRCSA